MRAVRRYPERDEFPPWGSSARVLSRPRGQRVDDVAANIRRLDREIRRELYNPRPETFRIAIPQRGIPHTGWCVDEPSTWQPPRQYRITQMPTIQLTPTTWTTANTVVNVNMGTTAANDAWCQWTVRSEATGEIWTQWANSNATATSAQTWGTWIDNHEVQAERRMTAAQRLEQVERQREFAARERRRWEEADRQAAERQKKTEAAKVRAYVLLDTMLSDEQRKTLKEKGWFLVRSQHGNLFRINRGSHGNIERLDLLSHEVIETWCVQPQGVPAGDAMLVQKLMLESHEEELFRTANVTPSMARQGGRRNHSEGLLTGDRLHQWLAARQGARA